MFARLIFPVVARLHRVDPAATAVRPGVDPDFIELRPLDTDGDLIADVGRAEHPVQDVLCQVEPEAQEALELTPGGDAPRSRLVLVFSTRHLQRQGLYDRATGRLDLRAGDRVSELASLVGTPLWRPRAGAGLYLTEARLASWGLGRMPAPRLVIATFEDRPAARRGG